MLEIKDKLLKDITFIDLFAGLGGFRLSLESFGAKCVYSNDWDKAVQKIYESNFGSITKEDITKINEEIIPYHDILCAGFPCQPFSISGKKQGFKDTRGTLFFDVVRIVRAKQPKVVFMENVKNFASHDNGRTLNIVKKTMVDSGYTFFSKVLNAVDFGIPQKRERIYMVCFRKDLNISDFKYPEPFKLEKHLDDFLLKNEALTKELYVKRDDTIFNTKEDNKYDNKPIRLGIVNKGGQGERIYSTKGIAITLSAYGGGVFSKTGGYLINGKTRKLHPRECARLMGFPDSYKISENKNQAYKQLGNSVVVDVLQLITYQIALSLIQVNKTVIPDTGLVQTSTNHLLSASV